MFLSFCFRATETVVYLVAQPNSMDIPLAMSDKIRRKIKQDSHKIFRTTENNMTIIDEYRDD